MIIRRRLGTEVFSEHFTLGVGGSSVFRDGHCFDGAIGKQEIGHGVLVMTPANIAVRAIRTIIPIRAGIDSIEHGAFLDDETLDLMKTRGTYYIPTLMAIEGGKEILAKGGYPPSVASKMTAAVESLNQVVRKAISKGLKIGMGTDAAVYPHGRNTEEFHLLLGASARAVCG